MAVRKSQLTPDTLPVGLMSPAECERLSELAAKVPADHAIVEVGSYRGLSSAFLVRGGAGARVVCIDTWPQPQPGEPDLEHAERQRGALAAFTEYQDRQGWPVVALRASAVEVAAMWLQPVGMLFHDAAHDFASVKRDLLAWVPHHLASGGIVAVHDYLGDHLEETDVALAVADVLRDFEPLGIVDKLWVGRRP